MTKRPGIFTEFNGLWARGTDDDCPPDHFTDSLNLLYKGRGFQKREGSEVYFPSSTVRMRLFKPLPPFTSTNYPRVIYLKGDGTLIDIKFTGTPLTFNANAKDFALVNFYGRAYISLSNGKTGLPGVNLKVYDGVAPANFRDAGGTAPTVALTGGVAFSGNIDVGTYLIGYAFETASGFITKPVTTFTGFDAFGGQNYTITNLPTGPAGTVARWIIVTKSFSLATIGPLGGPYQVGLAEFVPTFFYTRINDNVTTSGIIVNFFDEQLVDSADYLFSVASTIPAGVGLIDYNSRLVSYGESATPSIVRISEPGEPESFSATSGFLTTDPSDSTGVRSATEFRKTLYFYKRERGYVTQDNGEEPSTWEVTNFEKSRGTEAQGIADVMDAKGSSSEGYLIASLSGLYFFDGVFEEPELSYKIRDLWFRINPTYFHLVKVAMDPNQKRIYVLVPLDGSTFNNYILYADYRNGLNAKSIKWCPWSFTNSGVNDIIVFTDLTNDVPSNVTLIGDIINGMNKLNKTALTDSLFNITAFAQLAPTRFYNGLSQFSKAIIRALGPCSITLTAYGQDKTINVVPTALAIGSATPGREYHQKMNLISEQCLLKLQVSGANDAIDVKRIELIGAPIFDERPA